MHRRFGKTVWAVNQLIKTTLTCPKPYPRTHYVAPFLKQAKAVAWDYVQQYTRNLPEMEFNQNELRADFGINGGRLELCGAENYDKHRGKYSDCVVMDEVAQMPPAAWREVFRPALSDRLGRAIFIGTPKGRDFFYELWARAHELPDWRAYLMTAKETDIIPAEELAALEREMSPEEFDQEMNCNWDAANVGAIYAEEMALAREENRIREVPHDEGLPVTTAWDLGRVDQTVVTFWQQAGAEVRLIDHRAYKGSSLPVMIRDVLGLPYTYQAHIAPHDIEVTEIGTGKTRYEQATELGIRFIIAPKFQIDEGINATKVMLKRTWIDATKCREVVEALRVYHREWDDVKRQFSAKPVHDWSSDYCDSVRYFAIGAGNRRGDWSKPINYGAVDLG